MNGLEESNCAEVPENRANNGETKRNGLDSGGWGAKDAAQGEHYSDSHDPDSYREEISITETGWCTLISESMLTLFIRGRWPYVLVAPIRICAGEAEQSAFLPRHIDPPHLSPEPFELHCPS